MTQRRTRWSLLSARARIALLASCAIFLAGGGMFAVTDSFGWLLTAIAGLVALRLMAAVGTAAARGHRT